MKKIIIFGTGIRGNEIYPFLVRKYEVVAFADNNPDRQGMLLHGVPVISAEQIVEYKVDEIIISVYRYAEIGRQLEHMGFDNIKVLRYKNDHVGIENEEYALVKFEGFDIYSKCEFSHPDFLKERMPGRKRKVAPNLEKTILMIAYSFPPEGGPAVQRTLKFAKYLKEYGYKAVVLTKQCGNEQMEDRTLVEEIPETVKVVRINDPFSTESLFDQRIRQELFDYLCFVSESNEWMTRLAALQWDEMPRLLPDARMLWEIECLKHLDENVDMEDVDVVYSTVPAYSQHFLGNCIKRLYHIPWVGDYRDLWTSDERYYHLYYPIITDEIADTFRPLEKKLVMDMDAVILAGGVWKDKFIERFHMPADMIIEITNGYDESDFMDLAGNRVRNRQFTLCYNGRLHHPNRDPIPLLQILNSLLENGDINKDGIRWIFNGDVKKEYVESIKREDKYHIVQLNGMLSHHESIVSAMSSDLLVFYGEAGENGLLNYPGKFYEYLRFGVPILCLSGHNSFQERILKETGLGENFDHDEIELIKTYILEIYSRWQQADEMQYRINPKTSIEFKQSIERFERRNLTEKLAGILDEVCVKKCLTSQ